MFQNEYRTYIRQSSSSLQQNKSHKEVSWGKSKKIKTLILCRCSNVHDYVDIDGNSTLESNKTEDYCKMEPQSSHLLTYPPTQSPPSPIPRPSGSFSVSDKIADRSVRRSFSVGPVNDIYSYRKRRENAENVFSIENYVNNRMLPEDLVEENMYGSWCSTSHKPLLLGKCDGSCSVRSGSIKSRKTIMDNREDLNIAQKCFLKMRPFIAVGMVMIGLIAGIWICLWAGWIAIHNSFQLARALI